MIKIIFFEISLFLLDKILNYFKLLVFYYFIYSYIVNEEVKLVNSVLMLKLYLRKNIKEVSSILENTPA